MWNAKVRRWARKAARVSLLLGVPLVIVPVILPRKAQAKGASRAHAAIPRIPRPIAERVRDLVAELRAALDVEPGVTVALVPHDPLIVSVRRQKDGDGTYVLSIEQGFAEQLTDDELRAVVAHELGHVWIFTHHPYLQTEELANQIALRVVPRDTLSQVYEKVWAKTGRRGTLVYLPGEEE